MPKLNAPCYKCSDRSLGCQSSCEKYKDYKNKISELNDAKMKARGYDSEYLDYVTSRSIKNKKTDSYKNKTKGR